MENKDKDDCKVEHVTENRKLIEKIVFDALDVGFYPAAVIRGDKREERTSYQDGWNAASMKILEQVVKAFERLDSISEDLAFLLGKEICSFLGDKLFVNLSDTFWYATADIEEIDAKDIPELARLVRLYAYSGAIYWASKKRGGLIPTIPDRLKAFEAVKYAENCVK